MAITYKDAGVDIDAGNQAIKSIKSHVQSTYNNNVLTQIGAFGGAFAFDKDKFNNPVLVSSADGVGTKLMVAIQHGKHDTIGQCLVNHCVNDILALGARPLFFLDYFAAGKLNNLTFELVVKGLAIACKENECVLIGGETAEMPGMYLGEDYDLSGTIIGAVEKDNILSNRPAKQGDILIGLPSNGLHTNGYSLVRKVFEKKYNFSDYISEFNQSLGDELLRVHKSYLPIMDNILDKPWLHGISHITGGGLIENTNRILPENCELKIDWSAWDRPALFEIIQSTGKVPEDDMRRTFNLGIGLVAIIDKNSVDKFTNHLDNLNELWFQIGEVTQTK
ncbi:MAG: phosphoribosylformylglycinamidine cyclo-ligase [Candidatus Marinimicrobia bacterium]|nr:phosphoribosylformylglycinamidine cyclo-ligase [Candidatus Neomarinimicrobiota bacterium]